MSTIVKSVHDALKARVDAVLDSEWTEHLFIFNLAQNGQDTGDKGWSVEPLSAINDSAQSILKTYTMNQDFQINLTRTNVDEIDDVGKISALLDDLYFEASEIFKDVLNTQIGIPTTVFTVSNPNISAPEFDGNLIILRIQVTIRWRESL